MKAKTEKIDDWVHRLCLAQCKIHSGTARPGQVDNAQWHRAQLFLHCKVSTELFTNRTGSSLEKKERTTKLVVSVHKLHGKWSPPLGFSAGTEPGFHATRHKCGLTFVARFSTMAGWGILLQAFHVLSDRRQQGHTSTSLLWSTCRFSFTSV